MITLAAALIIKSYSLPIQESWNWHYKGNESYIIRRINNTTLTAHTFYDFRRGQFITEYILKLNNLPPVKLDQNFAR